MSKIARRFCGATEFDDNDGDIIARHNKMVSMNVAHDEDLAVRLKETILIDGEKITFRPAKPVDERRIREHFFRGVE